MNLMQAPKDRQSAQFSPGIASISCAMAVKFIAFSLVALLFFSSWAWARPIYQDEARNAAAKWLSLEEKPMGSPLGHEIKKIESFTDEYGDPAYYVVHLAPSGLIFLPADDLVEPIIGFVSGATSYDPSPTNPLGALTNRDIPDRVAHVRQQEAALGKGEMTAADSPMAKAQKKWARLLATGGESEGPASGDGSGPPSSVSDVRVAPFVQSQWNQGTYCSPSLDVLNYYTPNNYVCGCVATAVAQVIRYFQYPTAGIGVHSLPYSVNDGPSIQGKTLGGDGNGGPYVWNNMPRVIDCQTITKAQQQEIGRLAWDVALALGMDFSSEGSGANLDASAGALVNVFQYGNYIPAGTGGASNFPEPNLLAMVTPNLNAGLPVIFSICSPGAHAVVCDGYGYNWGTMYHHINYGWGGASDGWYICPPVGGSTVIFQCVYNIYTSGKGEIVAGRVTDWKGNPLSGAIVQLTTTGKSPVAFATVTNTKGLFAFTHLASASTYNITVTAKGHTFPQFSATTGTSIGGSIDVGNVWMQDLAETIPAHQTVVSVFSSEDPSNYGDPVTFTATVAGSGPTPTGTVQFYYIYYTYTGSHQVGHKIAIGKPLTLSGGSASISTSSLTGTNSIMAAYSGDNNYSRKYGYLPDGQTVNPLSSTTTVSSSANPASAGQSITFTATVTGQGGTPTGKVHFLVDNQDFGSVTLTNGHATSKATSTLGGGDHTVTAKYSGSPGFQSSTGSLEGGQSVWGGAVPTTTTVVSNSNPSSPGESVTFTATVTGQGGTPTGTVVFASGGVTIGTRTLSGGSANFSTSTLGPGENTINANYSGDGSNFWPSTGTVIQIVSGNQTSTTAVASGENPSAFGDTVTFTATVTGSGGTPTGAVQFVADQGTAQETKMGTPATLANGTGSIQYSSLLAGNHTVTANYYGDANFAKSSGTLKEGQTVVVAQTYITDWTAEANNNIFTNLNEEFPNTGVGAPGSGQGVPNSTYLFDPATYLILPGVSPDILSSGSGYVSGSDLTSGNGIKFQMTSNSAGHDFMEIDGGATLTLNVPVFATSVYLLMSTYNGQSVNLTITGNDGSTATFMGVLLPDFNGGAGSGGINKSYTANEGGSLLAQTVLIVNDTGAGGTGNSTTGDINNYDLTELSFSTAGSKLANSSIKSVSITSNGYEALLLGVTVK